MRIKQGELYCDTCEQEAIICKCPDCDDRLQHISAHWGEYWGKRADITLLARQTSQKARAAALRIKEHNHE